MISAPAALALQQRPGWSHGAMTKSLLRAVGSQQCAVYICEIFSKASLYFCLSFNHAHSVFLILRAVWCRSDIGIQ